MRAARLIAAVSLGTVLAWVFYGPLALGRTVEGRVLANGVPVAGAYFHVMPVCYLQGRTDDEGRFTIPIDVFFADDIEICVEAGEGYRRTGFGEIHAGPWWTRPHGLDIELGTPRAAASTQPR